MFLGAARPMEVSDIASVVWMMFMRLFLPISLISLIVFGMIVFTQHHATRTCPDLH